MTELPPGGSRDPGTDAARLDALAGIARAVAHDTNNLLMAISGYASLALLDLPADAPARDPVERAAAATRVAAELTRELLLLAPPGSEAPIADLGTALGDVEQLLTAVSAPGTTVSLEPAGVPAVVAVAPSAVRRATVALALAMGRALRGAAALSVGAVPAGEDVAIELRWTGEGTGGRDPDLAAARAEIEPHGGTVERVVGDETATVLRLRLPAAPGGEAPEAPADGEPPGGEPPGGPAGPDQDPGRSGAARDAPAGTRPSAPAPEALVVDDEAAVGRVAGRLLEAGGWRAEVSPAGEDALRRLSAEPSRFAVVVLDLSMPGLAGAALVRRLRTVRPDVGIVVMSGYAPADVADELAAESVVFLQKPFTRASLADAVDQAVRLGRDIGAS